MKIKCEHCNSLIDIENQNKCYNCGAPYTDNKEYKEYLKRKEILEKEQIDNKLKTEKMVNDIVSSTFISFKITKIISFVIIIIILIVFGFILFKGLRFNNTINNVISTTEDNQDTEKIISTLIFNSDLELFKGAQNGFFINKLLNNVINKNTKYTTHIITITYKDKIYILNNDLLKLKDKFNNNKEYNILFDYDENGYINKVSIINK